MCPCDFSPSPRRAGPAVNIAIALALFIVLQLTGLWEPITPDSLMDATLLERLMLVNLSLVIFNMLPAFPMDGGRALRAVLAVLFAFLGWLANPLLILIALFVWTGAAAEPRTADIRAAVRGIPVERVMLTAFTTLNQDEPLSTVRRIGHGRDRAPVVRS